MTRLLHLRIRRRLLSDLVAEGYGDLAAAHMYVFQTPGPDGARPSELAVRTNTTKQAMNHLLAGLERSGYLRREQAADDRRATTIRLTPKGRAVERIMRRSSADLEREWAAVVGPQSVDRLRDALVEIYQVGSDEPTTTTP